MIINGTSYKVRQSNSVDLNLGYKIKEIEGGYFSIGDWVTGDQRVTDSEFIGTRDEISDLQSLLSGNESVLVTLEGNELFLGSEVSNTSGMTLNVFSVGDIQEISNYDLCSLSASFEIRGTPGYNVVTPSVSFWPESKPVTLERTRRVSQSESGSTQVIIKNNEVASCPLSFTLEESEAKQMKYFYASTNRLQAFTIPDKWFDIQVLGKRTQIDSEVVILSMRETIAMPNTHIIDITIREVL